MHARVEGSFAHPDGGYPIRQALIARGVIGDSRTPDILRFGFTPLYTRYVDAWDAVEHLRVVLESGEWREARFHKRGLVTWPGQLSTWKIEMGLQFRSLGTKLGSVSPDWSH